MELIKLTCSKIIKSQALLSFSKDHERAILCFSKYPELSLSEISLLMDMHPEKVKKILRDLTSLKVIKYKAPKYFMQDVLDALYKLIRKIEN